MITMHILSESKSGMHTSVILYMIEFRSRKFCFKSLFLLNFISDMKNEESMENTRHTGVAAIVIKLMNN